MEYGSAKGTHSTTNAVEIPRMQLRNKNSDEDDHEKEELIAYFRLLHTVGIRFSYLNLAPIINLAMLFYLN